MSNIREVVQIPLLELEDVDVQFYRQLQMKKEKADKKFGPLLAEMKEAAYHQLACEGIFDIYPIVDRTEDTIIVEGPDGRESFTNPMMAKVLAKSEQMVLYCATVKGYDAFESGVDNFMKQFIVDAWGTTFAECAGNWVKRYVEQNVLEPNLYTTCAWSPGQHGVDIRLQRNVFRLIEPETIGVRLNDSCMMQPQKSVTSFFGVSRENDLVTIRPCDFCEHRETCPSAYQGN